MSGVLAEDARHGAPPARDVHVAVTELGLVVAFRFPGTARRQLDVIPTLERSVVLETLLHDALAFDVGVREKGNVGDTVVLPQSLRDLLRSREK